MPTPLYRDSIDFENVIVTPTPDPAITLPVNPLLPAPAFTAAMGMIVRDDMGNSWAAFGGVAVDDNGSGVAEFRAFYSLFSKATNPPSFVDGDNPWLWGGGTTILLQDPPNSGGAGFLSGGTLAVEKDFDNNRITLITPIGSAFQALDVNDFLRTNTALNSTPLSPSGIAFDYNPAQDTTYAPQASTARVDYQNFIGTRDGTLFVSIPMTLPYPGGWVNVNEYGFDATLTADASVGGVFSARPVLPIASAQLIDRYEIRADLTIPSYPNWDHFDAWRYLLDFSTLPDQTDMDASTEHGIVWRAGPDILNGPAMLIQRTFNNAGSWDTHTIFSDITTSNNSPSVTWYNQRLYVTWHNGTDIVQSRSLDGGVHWDMPTVIPFAGTNPRRIVDRTGGGSFLFYFDATNHLKVVITYDGGGSYLGPYTVASSVVAQQIDAEFVPDGSIVASLFIAGVWTQFRSRDIGVSWQ